VTSATGKGLSYKELSAQLTVLKQQEDTSFLHEVSCVPVEPRLRHLKRAYVNFLPGARQVSDLQETQRFAVGGIYQERLHVGRRNPHARPAMDEPLAIVWSRPLPHGAQPSTVTVSRDQTGRYFVSILVMEEMVELAKKDKQIGIDLGLKTMVATSDGQTFENPKYAARDEKKLARAEARGSPANRRARRTARSNGGGWPKSTRA
jgi:putative transposase